MPKELLLYNRDPGKGIQKQQMSDHDQLIYEFERLTSDPDELLGVLEDTLYRYDECGDEADFEAKRLLCALFQVQIAITIKCILH